MIGPVIRFSNFTEPRKQCRLGDLGSLKNGMNFSKDAMDKGFPFVNLQNVFGNNEVDIKNLGKAEATEQQLRNYNLIKGDVLFVRSSVKLEGVGEAAVVPENLKNTTYSGFIIRFRDEYGLDDNFKKYIFSTKQVRDQIMSQATNSANKNISQPVLENLQFYIPEQEEQEVIGYFFKQINDFIIFNQNKLDKIKNLKQAFIQKLFPPEGAINSKLRFKSGKENWRCVKLGKLCIPLSIKNGDRTDLEVFSVSNKEGFIRQTEHFKDNEVASKDKSNYKIVSRNQFAYNPSRINVGSIARLKDEDAVIVSPLYVIFECGDDLDETFLEYFLKTEAFDKQRRINTEISVRETLSYDGFSKIDINIPKIEEQREIGLFLNNLDKQIKDQELKIEKLKNLKSALLQKMFI